MPSSINPADARIIRDIKNYRRKLNGNDAHAAAVRAEIKQELRAKDGNKYQNPTDQDLNKADSYRDFASFQEKPGQGANRKKVPNHDDQTGAPKADAILMPNRFGGGLPWELLPVTRQPRSDTNPDGVPNPKAPNVSYDEEDIEVRADGAIVHKDPETGEEIEAAHHYMHAIFDIILYKVRDLLEAINKALENYADAAVDPAPGAPDPALLQAGAYLSAVTAFNDYCESLQPNGSSLYASAFNFVGIDPVVTNEGFIVSCRVKLNWKNPYHSSSTIKIP